MQPRFSVQLKGIWESLTTNGSVWGGRIGERSRVVIRRPPRWILWILLAAFISLAVVYETRTSAIQSRLFSYFGGKMTYRVQRGPSASIVYPTGGPFDVRYGYSNLAQFQFELEGRGFLVAEQARFSPLLYRLAQWGITPPYRSGEIPGLIVRSADGRIIYDGRERDFFGKYEEIPPVVVNALLLIENRQLAVPPPDVRNNPVVEWDRLAKAAFSYAGSKVGLPVTLEGGSTLATQLEKYRHSPAGRTGSASDKFRQLIAASLKAYRDGVDTSNARREIVVDYLNSMPLAAVRGAGEVNGLGHGLRAWFGTELEDAIAVLRQKEDTEQKAGVLKQVLYLLAAVRGPAYYLIQNPAALEARVQFYTRSLVESGALSPEMAERLPKIHLNLPKGSAAHGLFSIEDKLSSTLRTQLAQTLGVEDLYALNRLDLQADVTINAELQSAVQGLFGKLKDDEYLRQHGLFGERLLESGSPGNVNYSMILFESTPHGNMLRVQADNLSRPLDINTGMKMELGSTAKLRTLVHYLEVIASLHQNQVDRESRFQDPLTVWMNETQAAQPHLTLRQALELSLDRTYSASPYEAFFTGSGLHTFGNFDPDDNGRRMTLREATRKSTNLVFIRLMRDLVRYHQYRLPYDVSDVMTNPSNPMRIQMLGQAAESESKVILLRSFRNYRLTPGSQIIKKFLGSRAQSPRHLTILFFAWTDPRTRGEDPAPALERWLQEQGLKPTHKEIERLLKAYGNPRLNLSDYAYLLDRHPIDLWCAGEVRRSGDLKWADLWARSEQARQISSTWLFKPKNRRAQDLRLRIRVEQDAFARMTPYWQRLGFPFDRLVASYATAIGNSSDRPYALAELLGIIVNDGVRKPVVNFRELRFGYHAPYHTVLRAPGGPGERVMQAEAARALRSVLVDVVDNGTGRRVAGIFKDADGKRIPVGGKTGSGDNRLKSFSRGGGVIASKAVNRTATFAFFIGDRYFGVVTASVLGEQAGRYRFTSALPVEILKQSAPGIMAEMRR